MIEQFEFGFKVQKYEVLLLPCQKCVDIFKNAFEIFLPKLASF